MFYADKLSSYIKSVNYRDIPKEVLHKAKQCVIDCAGCLIAGSRLTPGKILVNTMATLKPNMECAIWGAKTKSSLLTSVYVNAALADAMDFGDIYYPGGPRTIIHPAPTVIPPAFSLGEYLQSSGKQLLSAIVAGYEIQARIGEATTPSDRQIETIKGEGTYQTFAAMAVAAKLLNLKEKEISNAFGIAGSNAPVPSIRKSWGNRELGVTMVKNNCATASLTGVLSVLLARNGFTGPANIFEGEKGFWRMMGSDQFFPNRLTSYLGERYKIMDVSFKAYPCGHFMHSSIDAVLKAVGCHDIQMHEIDSILIRTHPFVAEFLSAKNPKNCIHGSFSLPFIISLQLLGLPYGFDEQFRDNIRNRDVRNLMRKVEIEGRIPKIIKTKEYYPAQAIIKSGRNSYSESVDYPTGSRMNPMSDDQLKEKFFTLTEDQLGRQKSRDLFEKLWGFEKIKNVKKEIIPLIWC